VSKLRSEVLTAIGSCMYARGAARDAVAVLLSSIT
jgi:hypothetical protein